MYNHFKALDLSSDLFIIDWFLSLYGNINLEDDFVARIWDNFFLEGEIYAVKVGLALIEFFQLELKMSSFE